jgi:hypothetical protein
MRKMLVFIYISILALTSGCVVNEREVTISKGNEIIEALKSQDKEGLKALFSVHTLEEFDVDAQIDEAFKFMEGEIVGTYDSKRSSVSSSTRGSVEPSLLIAAHIDNIETTSGEKYNISFVYMYLDTEDADNNGLSRLRIFDEEDNECEMGGYQEFSF